MRSQNGGFIDDQYNLTDDTEAIKQKMFAENDEDDEKAEGKKDGFLQVYDESKNEAIGEVKPTDLGGEIKLRADDDGEQQTSDKPMIQEVKDEKEIEEKQIEKVEQPVAEKKPLTPAKPQFSWETAQQVEAKYTFMDSGELLFVTFNFKGYRKEQDVRYALSENEILLEVRDEAKNTVHRTCQTLSEPINSQESSIQLLVDFIVFKLKKEKTAKKWDSLGMDIKDFQVPDDKCYMRSNFLKQKSAQVGETEEDDKENKQTTNLQQEEQDPEAVDESKRFETQKDYHKEGFIDPKKQKETELSPAEKERLAKEKEDEAIEKIREKQRTHKQMCFLQLESDVFKIY